MSHFSIIEFLALVSFMAMGGGTSPAVFKENPCGCRLTWWDSYVCGSNGKLYLNDCDFECAVKEDLSLTEVRRSTECNDQIQPACGSDGQTYSNDCQFHCAQAANKAVYRLHDGAC